jgi:hypothetical protein
MPMRLALPFPPTFRPSAPQEATQHSSNDSARGSTAIEPRNTSLASHARPSSPVAARPSSESAAGDPTDDETHDPSELQASCRSPTEVVFRQRTQVPKSCAKSGGSKPRGKTKRTLGAGKQLDSLSVSGVHSVPQTLLGGSFFRLRPRPAGTFEGDDWGATVAISCRYSHGTILFDGDISAGFNLRRYDQYAQKVMIDACIESLTGIVKANLPSFRNSLLQSARSFSHKVASIEQRALAAAASASAHLESLVESAPDTVWRPVAGLNFIRIASNTADLLDQPSSNTVFPISNDTTVPNMTSAAKQNHVKLVSQPDYRTPELAWPVGWGSPSDLPPDLALLTIPSGDMVATTEDTHPRRPRSTTRKRHPSPSRAESANKRRPSCSPDYRNVQPSPDTNQSPRRISSGAGSALPSTSKPFYPYDTSHTRLPSYGSTLQVPGVSSLAAAPPNMGTGPLSSKFYPTDQRTRIMGGVESIQPHHSHYPSDRDDQTQFPTAVNTLVHPVLQGDTESQSSTAQERPLGGLSLSPNDQDAGWSLVRSSPPQEDLAIEAADIQELFPEYYEIEK